MKGRTRESKKLRVIFIAIALISISGLALAQGWGLESGREFDYGFLGIDYGINCPAFSGEDRAQVAARYQMEIAPPTAIPFQTGR